MTVELNSIIISVLIQRVDVEIRCTCHNMLSLDPRCKRKRVRRHMRDTECEIFLYFETNLKIADYSKYLKTV